MAQGDQDWRGGRLYWGITAFLIGFVVVLLLVSKLYLWPALAAAHGSDPTARRALSALSALVLTLVLVGLLAALVLIIRPGRLFFPRKSSPRIRTPYVDAWGEAGRRLDDTGEKKER